MSIKALFPKLSSDHVRWIGRVATLRRVTALPERWRLRRIATAPPSARGAEPEAIRIRALGGHSVLLRPATSDAEVLVATFCGQFHLPPSEVAPRLIWDLGANIGLTMAHMAHVFPNARVIGVEPDAGNADLARRNVAPWRDRCTVVEAAAWFQDGSVGLSSLPGLEAGIRINEGLPSTTASVSLNTLLVRCGAPDYVKVDIEGAESRVLTENTEWASDVRYITVECHAPYTVRQCTRDLDRLGFCVLTIRKAWRRRAYDTAVAVRLA